MTIESYLPYVALGSSLVVIAAMLIGLKRALDRADWPPDERAGILRVSTVVLIGWFVFASALGWFGAYRGTPDGIPTIQFGLFVPILVGVILFRQSETVARLIDAVPQPWLVAIQFYRVFGFTFLALFAAGQMPGLFALPAGLGDIAVGLAAPIIALMYARNPSQRRRTVGAWNVLGIADLVAAVTMGFITAPSPLQLFAFDAPNELISAFPLVLVPVYLVPLSILLHLASLIKLRRAPSEARAIFDRRTISPVMH